MNKLLNSDLNKNIKTMNENTKILIIRLSALGDTIHTLPLASAIKKAYPNCRLDWLVEDKAQHFIHNNPLIDKCFVLPRGKWKKRGFSIKNIIEFFKVIRDLRKEEYDIVIDTQQLFKSASIMAFLNVKRKITHTDGREFSWIFANEFVKSDRKQFDHNYHVVRRNLDFARHLGVNNEFVAFDMPPVSQAFKEKVQELLSNLDSDKQILCLAPATTWKTKHWNESYWVDIINRFSERLNVIMTGSSADLKLIDSILSKAEGKRVLNLAGKTNLMELSELYRASAIVVSPDSGSAHIAWAVQKPSVITVFCATSKNRTGPFGPDYYSLAPDLACYPCMKKHCKKKENKNICTSAVNSTQVINIINNLLH